MTRGLSYEKVGVCAIVSGIIGLLAFAILIGSLFVREQSMDQGNYMARFHDAAVIIQFLLLIPVVTGFYDLSQRRHIQISQTSIRIGIGSLCLTIVFILLQFPNIFAIVLYMFPQGLFGAWLIFICLKLRNVFSRSLRWFGITTGFGLILVGMFPVGYAAFVDSIILRIPAAPDEEVAKVPTDTIANTILHIILNIGTLIGVLPFPIWTILAGRRLRREVGELIL